LVVSHDADFVEVACDSIADIEGGRLSLYTKTPLGKMSAIKEERRKSALATVEKQRREEQRLQAVVNKWENVDRSKAFGARQALAKLAPEMEAAQALLVARRHRPRLKLATPPKCGARPLSLEDVSLRHAEGTAVILDGVSFDVGRGQRIILRGPNGAGKSTLLKALAGTLPLAKGTRLEDERLRLGIFAQDLAQELPMHQSALEYVANAVRQFDGGITEERCRSVMGALGLTGDKAVRIIGALSGGEKARVALATFCLTPYNMLLFDEPSNHLDMEAIAALLEALDGYEGAMVVVSHDRAFCEALRCTHVVYVADGNCRIEERELRDTDFSEADRGVRNLEARVDGNGGKENRLSPQEAKAAREAERKRLKLISAAPKKIAKVEAAIAQAEAEIEQLDTEMLRVGTDVAKLTELDASKEAVQRKVNAWYAEWEELEALLTENIIAS